MTSLPGLSYFRRRRRRPMVVIEWTVRTIDGHVLQHQAVDLDPRAETYPAAWQWCVAGDPRMGGRPEWAVKLGDVQVDVLVREVAR